MMKWYNSENDKPCVTKVIVEYSQLGDCFDEEDSEQILRLEAVDNGIAPFIRMSTPSGYFSISNINDLKPLIDDFYKKVNYESTDNCNQ